MNAKTSSGGGLVGEKKKPSDIKDKKEKKEKMGPDLEFHSHWAVC